MTTVGGFLADWNRTHLFDPDWLPHAKFHDALSIALGTLVGACGLYFLRRRGKDPQRDLALGAMLPSLFWVAQGANFAFPGAGGFEAEFPEKVPRLKGVWINERFSRALMLALIVAGYAAARRRGAWVSSQVPEHGRRPAVSPAVYNRRGVEEERRYGSAPTLLRAALAYARRDAPVFPCEPAGKRPLTRNGHWDATTDPRVIERWWRRWPSANVGVPTGKKSGLVVLDVDLGAGGPESLTRLERVGGPVPRTARVRTGGGGIHIFFRHPTEPEIRNSAGRLGSGLDVRGEGGYVVVPPSRTEGPYVWVDRSPPAPATWLLRRLAERSGAQTLF